jgi:type II secretory pathway pseudopilin PulG
MMIVILVIAVLATIVGLAVRNVGSDARASAAAADVKILNTASALYQSHTDQVPANQQALLTDPGVLGWEGPYIEEIAVAPTGWSYSMDPATGHWTATGP